MQTVQYLKQYMLRIKQILQEKALSAKTLAERMGVTPQYINGVINERDSASIRMLAKIAKELDVPLAALFDDYDKNYTVLSTNGVCPHCGKKIAIEIKKDE